MKRLTAFLLTGTLIGCAAVAPPPPSVAEFTAPAGALMVVIADPRSERRRRGVGNPGYSTSLAYADDPALDRAARALARDHNLQLLAQWPLRNLAVHCLVVVPPTGSALTALQNDERVSWLQPFNEFSTEQATAATGSENALLNNSGDNSGNNSARPITDVFAEFNSQGDGVRIAVVDTSIDSSHPDLARSSVSQRNFAGSRGVLREEPHGTAVVGLIAAVPTTPDGLTGWANAADVRVLRACWQRDASTGGKCNTLTLALALDAAIDLQPDILNLSLTGGYDRVLEELLTVLLDRGTLVVAAWDEDRALDQRFPSDRTGVIYAYGRSTAEPADLRPAAMPAPAGAVLRAPRHALSLKPMAGYDLVSGHSIAAPHISALAARLVNRRPEADRQQILRELEQLLGSN